jgi:Ca2+-binding EF-hand superfamily protein
MPLERDAFAALDRNRDGKLSAAELAGFADRAADFEVRVRMGKRADKAPLFELARPAKAVGKDALLLDAGVRLEMRADASSLTPRAMSEMRQRFEREFGAADRDRDGRLDRREAEAAASTAVPLPPSTATATGSSPEKN